MKRGTPRHPKTTMLAKELGVPRYAAVGVLESLWHWAAQYAKSGDVGRYSNAVIAEALDWNGDADRLVDGLVNCGWLDADREHRLVIHDWFDHAEDAVHMSLARGGERFVNGAVPKMNRLPRAERLRLAPKYETAPAVAHKPHDEHTACTQETHCHGQSLGQSQGQSQSVDRSRSVSGGNGADGAQDAPGMVDRLVPPGDRARRGRPRPRADAAASAEGKRNARAPDEDLVV